jgi:drug/metabolite transporter (DMT)-like permease
VRFAGELAALGTAVCWATGSNLFAAAGRRMGSLVLNRLRITVGLALLATALWIVRGTPWPSWATGEQTALLAISGLIGFVFGDSFWFRSLIILGPGRASLLASTTPIFTTALGWAFLGETPGPLALAGMFLIVGGIVWVLQARAGAAGPAHVEGSAAVGVVAGLLGALGQAGGYVLSKRALTAGIDPLSATLIRVAAATAGIWALAALTREVKVTLAALGDRRASAFMAGGAFLGPFLGVLLSLVALQYVPAGVASSITAFYPILAMAIAARFHDEPMTWRKLAGALVAVAGVVVLFAR